MEYTFNGFAVANDGKVYISESGPVATKVYDSERAAYIATITDLSRRLLKAETGSK